MGLSYPAFVDALIVACAVVVERQTNALINLELATRYIKESFGESWPQAAMRQLADDGMLRGSYSLKQQAQYNLTGHGLMRAEQLVESQGRKFSDLIEDYKRSTSANDVGG